MIYDGVTSLEARRPINRPADDGFEVSDVPDYSTEWHSRRHGQCGFEQGLRGRPVHVPERTAPSERAVPVSHNHGDPHLQDE